jgi:arginyl-tRNA--protein-N-Asp/Glu arginylyltransferase
MLKITEDRFRWQLKEDIKRLCALSDKLFLEEDKFESVFQLYRRYEDAIHQRIEESNEKEKNDIRMDKHKVATAFFCAILTAQPIGRKDGADKFYERTVNEQLALIFSASYIIDTFNISDETKDKMDAEIYGLFIKFPECQHSKYKDYVMNFIMLLDETQKELLNIDSEKFQPSSLFVISHLFFLIDVYSYQKNRCRILEGGLATDTNT